MDKEKIYQLIKEETERMHFTFQPYNKGVNFGFLISNGKEDVYGSIHSNEMPKDIYQGISKISYDFYNSNGKKNFIILVDKKENHFLVIPFNIMKKNFFSRPSNKNRINYDFNISRYPYKLQKSEIPLTKYQDNLDIIFQELTSKNINKEKDNKRIMNNSNNSNITFNLLENHFYDKKEISKAFGVGAFGGIRPNKRRNLVILFFDSHPIRKITDYQRNIYQDYFNEEIGIYYYTGQGQKGNQSLSKGGNRWLYNAKLDNNIKVFLFKQYHPGGKHEFIGQVKVIDYYEQLQSDADGNKRNVIVFLLQPIKSSEDILSNKVYKEIDLKLETYDYSKIPSEEELEKRLSILSENISKKGATKKIKMINRTEEEYIRFKQIVENLKLLYKKDCQVCGTKHFNKNRGVYSEVHHLTPWSISHDDTRENLVVVCANCHRKFHYAQRSEKESMYKMLLSRFPKIKYK